MLTIHDKPRGSGKTTECIARMRENKRFLLAVFTRQQKEYYPKELHNRIVVGSTVDEIFEDIRISNPLKAGPGEYLVETLIIDEGLMGMSRTQIAKFYYHFGGTYINVEMYCTDSQEKHTL
ncbi:MAG: hypothetical protein RR643_04930 [Anaerorhabdus sp.]|uniref:hypothetical protein n=1 Tax=Anaerorhabdus sp. TaxID=1872524 RepID=UPI002FC85649